jgi:ABC-type bacteriocin/lantibiotic exporter with double-glycine peptidase domain
LVSFFQARGCQAFAFKGTLEELWHHLQKGRPLIVGLGKKKGANHFAVVTGIDQGGRYIVVNDPADRQMAKSAWEKFNREWSRTGNWTLLVLPPVAGH